MLDDNHGREKVICERHPWRGPHHREVAAALKTHCPLWYKNDSTPFRQGSTAHAAPCCSRARWLLSLD